MRRFLSLKLASSNVSPKLTNTSNSSVQQLSRPSRIYSTFTNPCHHNYKQTNSLFNFSQLTPTPYFSSYQSSNRWSWKLVAFSSNPMLPKHFMSILSCNHFRVSAKVGLLGVRFARGYSGFSSSFGYNARSRRSWFNRLSADNVVFGLILANVAVFLSWRILDPKFMSKHFMISLDNFKSGRVHTLLTSAFSHMDMEHIISNMIGLYFFGTSIGRTFGPEFLLKLYVAGAIGGSVFYLVHHAYMALSTKGNGMWTKDPSRTPGLGASGAVNAILLLDIFLHPRATLYLDFIIPVPAILLGIFLIGKDALRILEGDSNISGSAHLGGAAVAAIAYARIRKGRF
ncbi:RHOMBOID-like protein 12, mitochondrial [Euphorbia lathyris]|uniref:RHOMBOID-like protein 12, mitochondrial n=1 Tax=Euphorbia lathyris TaxID=212925 RepID=UPI0033143338